MKKIITVITMLLVVLTVKFASAEISGSISTKIASEYVAVNGFILHDKAVQQTNLFISLTKGFYADLWVSLPWDGKENFGKEVDGTIGWNGELGSTGLRTDVGVFYFNCISLSSSKGDIFNPYAKISKEIKINEKHSISPYMKIELPITVNADAKSGAYSYLGVQHLWHISETVSLNQEVYTVYDNGAHGLDKGWVGKYNVTASIQVKEKLSLSLELSAFSPLTSMSDRKTEVVPAIGLAYSF